jgi:hypothetical protein
MILKYYSEFYVFKINSLAHTRDWACFPGHQYTPTKNALQRVLETFGNLLFSLAKHHLSHYYTLLCCSCELESIDYLVLKYLNTGALPWVKYSEQMLFDE